MDSELQPFVGPRPFERADKELFFGRDNETDELLNLIVAHPVVLLYAQSGAGKTSLLNAGLIPALEQEGMEIFPPTRVSGVDIYETGPDSIQNVYIFNALNRWIDDSQEPRELQRLSLAEFLANRDHLTDEDGLPLLRVIIFDQFEEIFTSHQEFREHRKAFFDQIRIAIEGERGKRSKSGQLDGEHPRSKGDPLLRVLLVIREDYLAQMDSYAPQLPEKLRTRFRIERLREEAALAAVTGPLRMTNSRRVFAPGVAEHLVKDLTKIRVETFAGHTEVVMGEFVEPVQLQVVCHRLLEAIPEDVTEITEENLQDFGDVGHALKVFYEECLEKAVSKTGVKEASLRIWFENTLITPAGTRGTVFIGQSESGSTPLSAVKVLEDLHIIRGEWRAGAKWYELTHDRLIEPIQESNRKWLAGRWEQERILQRLEAKVSEWVLLGRGQGGLFDEVELLEVDRWMGILDADDLKYLPDLMPLIEKSRAAVEKSKREKEVASDRELKLARYSRYLSATLLVLFLLVLGVAVYIWQLRQDADEQARITQSKLLAAQALSVIDTQPDLALLLSIEAYDADKNFETRNSLLRSLNQSSNVTAVLREHKSSISSVAFSPDRATLASGGYDNKLMLWDVTTGRHIATLSEHKHRVTSVAFSPDGKRMASGSDDNTVIIWDVKNQKPIITLSGHEDAVTSVAFSKDGRFLASGSRDKTLILWDVEKGLKIDKLTGHNFTVNSVAFSPDGKTLASGSDDKSIILWDYNTQKQVGRLMGHQESVNCLAFSPDGRKLASGSTDKSVILWDVATRKPISDASNGYTDKITGLAFCPDGKSIASSSLDGKIRLWNLETQGLNILYDHGQSVNSIAYSPDGEMLAWGGGDPEIDLDQGIILWSITPRRSFANPFGDQAGDVVVSAAYSPDGKVLALGSWYEGLTIWDVEGSQQTRLTNQLSGNTRKSVYCLAYSPDGQKIAWGLNDGAMIRTLHGELPDRQIDNGSKITSVAFSRTGNYLALGRADGADSSIILIDAASEKPIGDPLKAHSNDVNTVAFSPDGKILASGSKDKKVILWDVPSQKLLATLSGHTAEVTSVTFYSDRNILASAGADKTIIIWDAAKRQEIERLPSGHADTISSIAFSPDGKLLASSSYDSSIILWDVSAENVFVVKKLGQLRMGDNQIERSLAFSPDSKKLISGRQGSKSVTLWDISFDLLRDRGCALASRNLTEPEWRQYMGNHQFRKTCPNLP